MKRYFMFVIMVGCSLAPSTANSKQVEGIVYLAHSAQVFIPCGTTTVWWFGSNDDVTNEIIEISLDENDDPFYLFISVEGDYEKFNDPRAEYIGAFDPKRLIEHTKDIQRVLKCVPEIETMLF